MSRPPSASSSFRGNRTAPAVSFQWTPNRLWMAIFGFWLLILTGVFNGLTGSPGLIQRLKLQSLLVSKQEQQALLEQETVRFEQEVVLLERDRLTQEKEVRRVLGYAGKDEIIFDFSTSTSVALRK